MPTTEFTTLHIRLTVHTNVTVLPRCLQVFSRRGYTLVSLNTKAKNDVSAVLRLTVEGPKHWHALIPELLRKLVDVQTVTVERSDE